MSLKLNPHLTSSYTFVLWARFWSLNHNVICTNRLH